VEVVALLNVEEVVYPRYQITVSVALVQVMLSSVITVGDKPIIVIAPFVEMMGYLPTPLKLATPLVTVTLCPTLLCQFPSKPVYVAAVNVVTLGRRCTATCTPLLVMLPEETFAMPGTAATLETMVSPSELELLMADCAAFRSASAASGMVADTVMEPGFRFTTIVEGSIVTPSAADMSAAIASCIARINAAIRSSFDDSES
jgi:hypothetical protein